MENIFHYLKDLIMEINPGLKPALMGAAGGAIALAIVGFMWGGWVTGGTAEQTARTRADAAVVTALAPICALVAYRLRRWHAHPCALLANTE